MNSYLLGAWMVNTSIQNHQLRKVMEATRNEQAAHHGRMQQHRHAMQQAQVAASQRAQAAYEFINNVDYLTGRTELSPVEMSFEMLELRDYARECGIAAENFDSLEMKREVDGAWYRLEEAAAKIQSKLPDNSFETTAQARNQLRAINQTMYLKALYNLKNTSVPMFLHIIVMRVVPAVLVPAILFAVGLVLYALIEDTKNMSLIDFLMGVGALFCFFGALGLPLRYLFRHAPRLTKIEKVREANERENLQRAFSHPKPTREAVVRTIQNANAYFHNLTGWDYHPSKHDHYVSELTESVETAYRRLGLL